MHYTNLDLNIFFADFIETAGIVWRNYQEKAVLFCKKNNLKKIEMFSNWLSEIKESVKFNQNKFGSALVPKIERVKEFLGCLQNQQTTTDWRRKFNLLTLETIFTLMLHCGLRPLEISNLLNKNLFLEDSEQAKLVITAKQNRFFKEWRTVNLLPQTIEKLKFYQSQSLEVLNRLRDEKEKTFLQINQYRQDSLFFLIGKDYYPRSLNTDNIRKTLDSKEVINTDFLWRLNFGRQFWRTTAANSEKDFEGIDLHLGHQTRGREGLGIFSTLNWSKVKKQTAKVSELVFSEIGEKP